MELHQSNIIMEIHNYKQHAANFESIRFRACVTGLVYSQGWGQIRFIKYKYKYKYIFFRSFKYKYKYKYTGKNLIKYKYKYKYSSSSTNTNTNTQWGRDKIAAILQMTYWNLLYCKKIVYTFKFHWKLFPKVQSTISLHWFR